MIFLQVKLWKKNPNADQEIIAVKWSTKKVKWNIRKNMRKVRPVKYVLRDFIRIFMVHVCNVMEKVTFFAHFSRDLSSKSLESAEKRKRVTTGSISFLTVVQNQFRERKS